MSMNPLNNKEHNDEKLLEDLLSNFVEKSISSASLLEHPIFELLNDMITFYDMISNQSANFIVGDYGNRILIDTTIFDSTKRTLESISLLLKVMRPADAIVLSRHYVDKSNMHIAMLHHLSTRKIDIDNLLQVDTKVAKWLEGIYKKFGGFVLYDNDNKKNKSILHFEEFLSLQNKANKALKVYNTKRAWTNSMVHANGYGFISVNTMRNWMDSEFIKVLDELMAFLEAYWPIHVALLYTLKPHYLMSSDRLDWYEMGQTPPVDLEDTVMPFIFELNEKRIRAKYPDISDYLLGCGFE